MRKMETHKRQRGDHNEAIWKVSEILLPRNHIMMDNNQQTTSVMEII